MVISPFFVFLPFQASLDVHLFFLYYYNLITTLTYPELYSQIQSNLSNCAEYCKTSHNAKRISWRHVVDIDGASIADKLHRVSQNSSPYLHFKQENQFQITKGHVEVAVAEHVQE